MNYIDEEVINLVKKKGTTMDNKNKNFNNHPAAEKQGKSTNEKFGKTETQKEQKKEDRSTKKDCKNCNTKCMCV